MGQHSPWTAGCLSSLACAPKPRLRFLMQVEVLPLSSPISQPSLGFPELTAAARLLSLSSPSVLLFFFSLSPFILSSPQFPVAMNSPSHSLEKALPFVGLKSATQQLM